MGPEIAGDEVVQAEPRREAAGCGLHAWVKVGGLRVCQLLLCVSSVGKEGGRESPAGLKAACALWAQPWGGGRRGQLWEGVGPAGWELKDPGNRPLWALACRLPVPAPRGTMGCLLGPGQELRVGVGEGEARLGRGRLARSGPAGQRLGHTGLLASPSGALTAQRGLLPQREGRGNWGSWQRRAWALRTLFQFPDSSSPSVSFCLPAGTRGCLGCGRGPKTTARRPAYCPAGPRLWEGDCGGGISRQ